MFKGDSRKYRNSSEKTNEGKNYPKLRNQTKLIISKEICSKNLRNVIARLRSIFGRG